MPAQGKSRRVLPLSKSRDERFQRSGSYRDAASRAREVPFVARKQLKRSQQNQRRARAIPVRSGAAFSRRPLARIVPRGHAPRLALSEHGPRCVPARGKSRLGVLVPSGDRLGPTEPAGETLACARALQDVDARARR